MNTPTTMDNVFAKALAEKDLATVMNLPIRNHVKWEGISYKGLYEVVLMELFYSGKCKSPKDLCFGAYDQIPFFACIYKGDNGICGVVMTASPKVGVCRIGYGVLRDGSVSPVKASGDIPWEAVPEPFKAIGVHLMGLTDKALASRGFDMSAKLAEVAANRTIALELALEKSKKAEAKATARLKALENVEAEKKAKAAKVVKAAQERARKNGQK